MRTTSSLAARLIMVGVIIFSGSARADRSSCATPGPYITSATEKCNGEITKYESLLSQADIRTILGNKYTIDDLKAVAEWYPLQISGWPNWSVYDGSDGDFQIDVHVFPGWQDYILRIYLEGHGDPLASTEFVQILKISNQLLFHSEYNFNPPEASELEKSFVDLINSRLKSAGINSSTEISSYQLQIIPWNQRIVAAINEHLGDQRIKHIYFTIITSFF
jgi:hypothetical protein